MFEDLEEFDLCLMVIDFRIGVFDYELMIVILKFVIEMCFFSLNIDVYVYFLVYSEVFEVFV